MYQCAQSAIQPNNLNLPVYDIHQKQARDQILFNFHTLANTAATISQRHMQKCLQQNERIQALRARIIKCKERIQSLGGLNQAIVFVSPSQYPTKYEFNMEANRSRFNDFLNRTQVNKLDMNAQYIVKHEIKELGKQAKLKLKDLDEFILFLFGKLKGKRKTVFQKGISNKHQIDNLGRIPTTIRYLDSLTVFNTNINPYKKYQIKDILVKIESKPNKKQNPGLQNNAIINDNALSNYQKQQFAEQDIRFIPGQKKWVQPEWDDNLGLGNVVDINSAFNDDISFINQPKKKTVAKDHMANKKQQNNNTMKTQSPNRNNHNYQNQNNIMRSNSLSDNLPINQPSSIPSLKPSHASLPPPPPSLGLPAPPSLGLPLPPPPSLGLPPPPPIGLLAPPPSIGLPPPPSIGLPPPLTNSLPQVAGGSSRAALLNDIQNPNLIKRLKKTVTKQYTGVTGLKKKGKEGPSNDQNKAQGSSNQVSSNAPPPMDMMSALKAKINQRFRALHPQHEDSD